ncbi:hypothetical protein AKJ09_05248 [Labilithrix luteola]|uniref:Putative membrane protein insertion efficiency factor n=2 Tax=Labilithrix luteola TaxID=1391654 RepID=A0A0K1PZK4_9BACT|nr:hypothetical protein AKJ09_05248 [Labilithrix luteola]
MIATHERRRFSALRPVAQGDEQPHLPARGMGTFSNLIKPALMSLIRLYQLLLSPLLGRVCRFEPSCSRYAMACIETHGPLHGSLLSVRRLCKCHPFHPGGYDPPPSR